ncbi:GIY-YIG catalytic domain-containing endonuclease [Paramecium bursaria Chlorella virus Fr5L]|nr:GIY-YIG catalytic domain-containing endonuclease [Paramecium bursaria Chlorella virus Fr5L]
MGFIYRLTFPSKKSYIGQTIRDIHKRLEGHQLPSSNCVAVYNAIQKYGWEKVEKEWYEVPDEDLNFYEEMLVALLGTLSPDGYNLKEGGGSKGRPSEESRQKMREAKKGEKHPLYGKARSEETKEKLREANLGKTANEETKQKLSIARLGKPKSEEHKQKLREANLGKIASEETKQKNREAHVGKTHTIESKQKMSGRNNHGSKKTYQYDLQGNFIQSFDCTEEAAQFIGNNDSSSIGKCARGKRKTAYGFIWSREPPN